MQQWNKAFKKKGKIFLEPQEDMQRIVKLFKERGVKKILDLGCGSGRHTVFLTKSGFGVFGIDVAKDGVDIAKKWLKEEGKKTADLRVGDIYKKLPYESSFFDALISTQTLHHNKIENIRKLVKEIERILKLHGLLFVTVAKHMTNKQTKETLKAGERLWKMKKIANRTIMPLEGDEKGLIHYFFDEKLLRKEFKNFKIHGIWTESSGRHLCLLAELKTRA